MEEKDVIALLESFMKEHTEKMHAEFDGVYSQVPIHHPAAMMHLMCLSKQHRLAYQAII
jgi:hypothetical protein